ncbi:MAG TPA: nucleotide exchange factor GrpE [Mycobacteriales bacterium]|nr:nucleotide exchange factor GrpE [Mycobacteriales bacterium]
MTQPHEGREDDGSQPERVVIRDKRRLDPESGAVRDSSAPTGAAPPETPAPDQSSADSDGISADARVVELTADLQRVSAEYANYRKRVDRDRVVVVEMATAALLSELLPVLDDVDRARDHGDLTGPFKSVGERLEGLVDKVGLQRFGTAGEPFDPAVHEALMQAEPAPDSDVAICASILQPGYRLTGGRVLRPARVAVAEPGRSAPQSDPPSSAAASSIGEAGSG